MNTSKKLKIALLSGAATLALSLGALTACGGEEHDLTFIDEQAATCTEAGHEAYYLCSHCGKLFADENAETELSDADVTIAALGHNMTEHAAKDATCTADGNIAYWSCDRCDKNFSDKDGSKEVANVVIPAGHDIDWVDLVEPTTSADGMLAHYECSVCKTCFEDANGDKEIEKADLTLAKLVEQAVAIKVEVYDTAGSKVASPDYGAISKQLTLKGAYSSNRYEAIEVKADGTLALDKIIVGDYEVDLYGYARSTFTVEKDNAAPTLKLYATIAYGSNEKVTVEDKTASVTVKGAVSDYQSSMWSGSAELVLSDELKESEGVILEFNVKNVTNSQASGNDEWASQRIAVQMAKGYKGFLFFLPNGEANIFDMTDSSIRDEGKDRFGENGKTYAWIGALMRGDGGVNMRVVRTDDLVTLFVQNEDAEWVKIGAVECADAETDIILHGCGVEWKFSSIAADALDFVAEKEATAAEPGNLAYYTDGTNYWFEDGTPTTLEGTYVYLPVDVALTVKGIALDGKTAEAVAKGTLITFTSRAKTYTYTVGGAALEEMVAGTYTVTAEGYRTAELTVPTAGGAIELTLQKVISIGKGATKLTNNAWNGQAKLPVPENLSENFLMEVTLKMSDFTQGFNDYGAWQRYAIRLTKGNVGFYLWSWNDGTAKSHLRAFSAENTTNAAKEGTNIPNIPDKPDYESYEPKIGFMTNELLDTDGLQLRILRAGNTFCLYAKNGENWVLLGSVECNEGDTIDMELYAGVGTYEWSNVKFTEVTYFPEKAAESAEKPGNVEYYTDGTNYWLADGTMTTREGTVVKFEVAVTLDLSGIALDGSKEDVAAGTVLTFTSSKATYTYTVGTTKDFKMSPDTYTLTAEGYRAQQVIINDTATTLDLTMTKAIVIAGKVEDYTSNKWSGSVTLDISEELKESTAVILEFNVQNVTNSQASGNDEWASQRIAIQMAKGYEGFLFFLPKGEANVFDMTDNGIADSGKTRFGGSGTALSWIDTLMRGENGVDMRIVRTGENVTLFVQNGEGEWVKIGTVACGEAETEIVFYGCGVEWAFTSVSAKKIEYVAEQEPAAGKPGNVEYYKDGDNYWLADGTMTDENGVALYAADVTFKLTGYELDGKTTATIADGTVITFEGIVQGSKQQYTYTVGTTGSLEMYVGTYTVKAEGYAQTTLTVAKDSTELALTLKTVKTIAGKVEDYTGNKWSDSFTLDLSDELKESTAVILEFNVRNVTNSAAGWPTDEWASQRIAIQMAKGNEGFLFFLPKGEANVFDMTDGGIANDNKTQFGGSGAALSWIDTLMRGVGGVNMRIVRTGANATLFVQNEKAEWVKIGTVACAAAETEIIFYGCGVEWAFSSITAKEIEYVAEKQPVAGGADGNVAYYTDGTNYWLADGTVTTAEDVVLSAVEVKLTVAGLALDGKTEATIAEGTVITLTGAYGEYTFKMGEAAPTQMLAATYTVTAEGYAQTTLVVPKEGGDLTLTLKAAKTIAGTVEDYKGGKWSDSFTLDISDELKASTAVILEFTVQNVTNSAAGWPTDEWASQRIAIQMAKGNEGFLFFLPKGEANVFDMTDNGIGDSGKTKFAGDFAWIDDLMRGTDGVNMRIVRTGANATLFVQNEKAEWVKIGTVACADAETEIVFYGCGVEWAFSSITAEKLTYVEAQEATDTEEGNVAYYTDGTNYWLADGNVTTAEDVVVPAEPTEPAEPAEQA